MTEHNTEHGTGRDAASEAAAGSPHATGRVVARSVREGTAHRSERTDAVVSWIGWHLGELTGVGVPVVLAVTAHPLWVVPAGLVAAGWIAHEVRLARRGRTKSTNWTSADDRPAATAPTSTPVSDAESDTAIDTVLETDAPGGAVSGEEVRRGLA